MPESKHRLALYFHENGNIPRILDTETAPKLDEDGCGVWQIGRPGHGASIIFDDNQVSRHQALIRCYTVAGRSQWQIQHSYLAKNRSYKEAPQGEAIALPAGQWLNINEFDRFFFVKRKYGFTATTEIDETLEERIEDDGGPDTENATLKRAIAEMRQTQKQEKHWAYELGMVILNGPDGFPNWLWWSMLLFAGMFLAWLRWS